MLLFPGTDVCIVPVDGFACILNNISQRVLPDRLINLNTILIGNQYFEYFSTGGWYDVELSIEWKGKHSSKEESVNRTMQVLCFPGFKSDKVILSEDDLFNFVKNKYLPCEIPFLFVKRITFNPISIVKPLKASEVKLCSIKTLVDEDVQIMDALLKIYFQTTKYLYKGDVFSIDGTIYLPELILKKRNSHSTIFYFLVCDILDQTDSGTSDHPTGCLVDYTVTIYQITSRNSFLPPKYNLFIKEQILDCYFRSDKFLLNLVPLSLAHYFDDLKAMFRPFLGQNLKDIDLNPLFMLSGVNGCGKSLLLATIAGHLGLNYQKICCSLLLNGTATRYNEARLKELFNRIRNYCPCLLQLDNFQSIGEGSDGQEDVRLIGTFRQLLKSLEDSPSPVVIVGTTENLDNISSNLMELVIHSVNITTLSGNSSDAIAERSETIRWLCDLNYRLSFDTPKLANDLALCTSGFTLRDLSFLLSVGIKEEYTRCKEASPGKMAADKSSTFEIFTKIIDKMNAESADEIGAPKVPRVNWADVGGHNQIKKEIVRSISTTGLGGELKRSGLLLWGPPGTGKTLLAKAVATECGSTFLSVKGPELLNKYIGQSEENVRQIFDNARQAAPCIIFFDELDSLAPNRGRSGDSGGVMDRVVSQLLSEMDGLQSNENVFILGATNRPDLIDTALLRPGRLDKMIYVGPCEDTESKTKVLEALTRKFKLSPCVKLEEIAGKLPSQLTGADLYSVCYGAWQNAAKNLIENHELDTKSNNSANNSTILVQVTADDFHSAIQNLHLST